MTDLLTVREAARRLKVSKSFLDRLRAGGIPGPAYTRVGRGVRYREADLDAWLARNLVTPGDKGAK